ncbi:hypothetical protein TCCBUS3UF1_270 [Thermus sp. CCB_US3_UF1]|uniref:hypothetical protein n=1 Tax=Thermus sp. CCB_US3_UF1 TaxID=1111069 RepID=UPI000238A1CC|nr:hypothetical protein [Thermus sp. CCB_US3_UF1]AEV15077.1 hypothetical protein TCCBUS3UF1_270 [Thermus sp. CCB_US3_UF1]
MRRFLALGFLLGLALAQGRLEGGVYASLASMGPTLEAALSLGEGEVYLRAQGGRAGLGYLGGLALGPLGYLAYGVQGELGEGGLGGVLFAEGGAGLLAFQGRLGYRPQGAFPLFPEAGPFGRLSLRYRLVPREVVGFLVEGGEAFRLEATYALRQEATHTLGLGVAGWPYLVLGHKGEVGEEGEVLDLLLRLGGINRLEAGLYLGEASLFLTLSHPWAGSVGAWLGDLGLEAGYRGAPYAWIRYVWRWP